MSEIDSDLMLPIGTVLKGKYRITKFLSSGGFGNTYEAVDIDFGARYAVKEYFVADISFRGADGCSVQVSNSKSLQIYNSQLDKFREEATLLQNLRHPGIVSVYDLFVANETAYYTMDLIDGESLHSLVSKEGPLSEARSLAYLRQILDALNYVHSHGLLHLDIKPANIMVEAASDRAILIDFGASKQFNHSKGGFSTAAPAYTAGYAPTEQINYNKANIGAWTDIYALGATLYALVTADAPPLPDDILNFEANAFHFPEWISPEFADMVMRMMRQRFLSRPQSVAQLLDIVNALPTPSSQTPKETLKKTQIPKAPTKDKKFEKISTSWPPKPTNSRPTTSMRNNAAPQKLSPESKPKNRKRKILLGICAAIAAGLLLFFFIRKLGADSGEVSGNVNKHYYTVSGVEFAMVDIPAGEFHVNDTCAPIHVDGFLIAETEVTQALWQAVMGRDTANGEGYNYTGDSNAPMTNVSWDDYQEFINRLNIITGEQFRMPTCAEWEYAARGGHNEASYTDPTDIERYAWCDENSGGHKVHPVAQLQPNEYGIYDILGNVCECCSDCFHNYPAPPLAMEIGTSISRGGCFGTAISNGFLLGAWVIGTDEPYDFIGLRLAKNHSQADADAAAAANIDSQYTTTKVGDYFYSNGTTSTILNNSKTCIGVVFSLEPTEVEKSRGWTHGQIVAIEDVENGHKYNWGPAKDLGSPHTNIEYNVHSIPLDKNGYIYTYEGLTNGFPAFDAVRNFSLPLPPNTSGWYIPSAGQWVDILQNIADFKKFAHREFPYFEKNSILKHLSKINISGGEYMTSSERDATMMHYIDFSYTPAGFFSSFNDKSQKFKIRAVAAF